MSVFPPNNPLGALNTVIDGAGNSVSNVTTLDIVGATVSDLGGGEAKIATFSFAFLSDGINVAQDVAVLQINGGVVSTGSPGQGTITFTGGGSPLEVTDGTATVTNVATITLNGGSITSTGTGEATLNIAAPSGSGIATLVAAGVSNTATSVAIFSPSYELPVFTAWLNQNGGTVTAHTDGPITINSTAAPGSVNNITARVKTLSAGAFDLRANLSAIITPGSFGPGAGILLSDGTKVVTNQFGYDDPFDGMMNFGAFELATPTTFTAQIGASQHLPIVNPTWLRIAFDGTTYSFHAGCNGFDWLQIASTTSLSLVPSLVGFFINTTDNTIDAKISLNEWDGA